MGLLYKDIDQLTFLSMDILGQYEKQNPEVPRQPLTSQMSQEFQEESSLVQFVMRHSGGKIQNARQASYVLLAAAIGIIIITVLILVFSGTPQGENRERLFPPGSSVFIKK